MPPRRSLACLAAAVATLALSGCNDIQPPAADKAGLASGPPEAVSVHELAQRLHMNVDGATGCYATLRNQHHTVCLFTGPDGGRAHVNGKPVGPAGGVSAMDGVLHVSAALAALICRATDTSPPPAADPTSPPAAVLGTVLLDPGHGGRDTGAPSVVGINEKVVNLDVSLRAAGLLRRRNVRVVMTRTTDEWVDKDDRVALARRLGPALFVSIHADAAPGNGTAHGPTVFVPRRAGQRSASQRAGDTLERYLAHAAGVSRGVRRHDNNLRVLEQTSCPAVLVELGFLTNRYEATRLATPAYRQRLAEALADGIHAHLCGN